MVHISEPREVFSIEPWVLCIDCYSDNCFASLCFVIIRCSLVDVILEMDRILRPDGMVLIRDTPEIIEKLSKMIPAIRWTGNIYNTEPESNGKQKLLVANKRFWAVSTWAVFWAKKSFSFFLLIRHSPAHIYWAFSVLTRFSISFKVEPKKIVHWEWQKIWYTGHFCCKVFLL